MSKNAKPDRKSRRRRSGSAAATLIYGWHSAIAALRNPQRRIHRVYATSNTATRLAETGLDTHRIDIRDSRDIDTIAGAGAVHQGIALECAPLADPGIDSIAGYRSVVVLDQVTDPHNVGAIFRTAAAFAADAIVMTDRHAPADGAVLAKAASGGLEHVPLIRVANLARALGEIGDHGFQRIGLDSGFSDTLSSVDVSGPVAIVLGAEGRGLRRLTRENCDHLVRLALPGAIASLNVSAAAAVVLYDVVSRRLTLR